MTDKTPAVMFGTAIFAKIDGKYHLIGTPTSKRPRIGPMDLTTVEGVTVTLPALRRVEND